MPGYGDAQGYWGSFQSGADAVGDQLAQQAAGRGLAALQAMNQNPMMMQPGQPPGAGPMPTQPTALPMGGSPGMGPPPPMGGGMPPQRSPMPQGQPPMGGPQMGSQPPPQMRPGVGGPPPPQQPPMQPQGPPGQMGGQGVGQLSLQQVVQAVQRSNPGAPPNVLFAAVARLMPLMKPSDQEYLRMQQLQNQRDIAALKADVQERGQDVTARGQDIRADTAAGAQATTQRGQDIRAQTAQNQIVSRETIAKMTIEERLEALQAGIISKQQFLDQTIAERGREADQRAGVAERGQDIRAKTAATAETGRNIRAEGNIESREGIAREAETGRNVRSEANIESKQDIAGRAEAGKNVRNEAQIESRENIAGANRGERAGEFQQRFEAGQQSAARKEEDAKARQDLSIKMRLAAANEKRRAAGLSDLSEDDFRKGNIPPDFLPNRPPQNVDEKNADDIASHKRPPIMSGWGGQGLPREQQAGTQSALQVRHPEFDNSQAVLQWTAEARAAGNMNSTQQIRFRALEKSISPLLDRVGELAKQMDLYGIPELNDVEMAKLRRQGNTPKGQLLARYETAFAAAAGEVSNFENGGYAPTDASWKTAYEQLDKARGVKAQLAALDEIRRITRYRIQGMDAIAGGLQPGGSNPYAPGDGNQPTQNPGIQYHYDSDGNLIGGPRSELGGREFAGGPGSGKIGGDAIMKYESIYDKPKPPKPLQAPPKGFKLDDQGNYAREVGQG